MSALDSRDYNKFIVVVYMSCKIVSHQSIGATTVPRKYLFVWPSAVENYIPNNLF